MLDYVYGYDEIVANFVAQLLPAARGRSFGPYTTIGIVKDDQLVAGVVYNNYRRDAGVIEMTTAALPGSGWMTRETLRRIYQYPFLQLDCQMIMLHVADDNGPLLRQLAALNHAFITLPRMYGRDKDCILCLLTREAWEDSKFNRRLGSHNEPLERAA